MLLGPGKDFWHLFSGDRCCQAFNRLNRIIYLSGVQIFTYPIFLLLNDNFFLGLVYSRKGLKSTKNCTSAPVKVKMERGMRPASMLHFLIKILKLIKWHACCIYYCKSDTLISFLLKKVCFVPQSRPFSISTYGKFPRHSQHWPDSC